MIPEEMQGELYDRLATYYADDPNVRVIIDRRKSERRSNQTAEQAAEQQREIRDRRRRGVAGEFPPIDAE